MVGERSTQKIILLVKKKGSLVDLAIQIRAKAIEDGSIEVAHDWARTSWMPHISLLYADANLDESERERAEKIVKEMGMLSHEGRLDEEGAPWIGARVLWVDTRQEIRNWTVIGERSLLVEATSATVPKS